MKSLSKMIASVAWGSSGRSLSRWAQAIIGVVVTSASTLSALPCEAQPRGWVHHLEESRESWRLVSQPEPWLKEIEPLMESGGDQERILIMFHKASPAYDVALARILRSFAARKRWSSFSLVYYGGAHRRLHQHLTLADNGIYGLIFAMGSESAQDLHESYRARKVPVVTVCAKDPVLLGLVDGYVGGSQTNIAYTSLNVPVAGQISYLKQFRPRLRQLAVVYSSFNTSAVMSQVEPLKEVAEAIDLAIFDVVVTNPKTPRRELEVEVEDAARKMRSSDPTGEESIFWITGSTAVFSHMDVIRRQADRFPVLAVTPSLVNGGPDGALLSIGVSFESNAELASVYALQILSGRARVGDLDVGVVMPPDIAIDMSKAKASGLAIPFRLFEAAGVIYDYEGRLVRSNGRPVP